MIRRLLQNHHLVLSALFLLAFFVRGFGLAGQPPLDDEVGAAFAATNYMEHGHLGRVMWYHPPLRNLVIYISGEVFGGFSAWGLRGGSVLLGSLTVPVLGYLAYSLFNSRPIACLAALFLCIDPLHISLSRVAFQETTTVFFIVTGVLITVQAIKRDDMYLPLAAGAAFGLAAASKWHGLFPWAVSAAAFALTPWIRREGRSLQEALARLLTAVVAYGIVPAMVYIAVYIPWLERGYSLAEFLDLQAWLIQRQYLHQAPSDVEATLLKGAYWWFIRPTAWTDFVFFQGKAYLNVAMGNYLIWVLTLPSLAYAARLWMRERSLSLGFALALFAVSYLPLVATTRPLWAYNSLAVIPFAFLIIAATAVQSSETGRVPRKALAAYLVAAILLSAAMYPMSTMRALEYQYLKPVTELYSPHVQKR